jgi:hypothetical protein
MARDGDWRGGRGDEVGGDGGGVLWFGVNAALRWSSKRVGTKSTKWPTNVRAPAGCASDAYVKAAPQISFKPHLIVRVAGISSNMRRVSGTDHLVLHISKLHKNKSTARHLGKE